VSGRRGADALLETVLVVAGAPRHLELHRARMARSAAALGWPFAEGEFDGAVQDALAEASFPRARLRLLLAPGGSCLAALYPLGPPPDEVLLALSRRVALSADPLARHKVLPRELYDSARAEAEEAGAWDGLLSNERGEIAETGRASVVALVRGRFLTPPLEAGILDGVTRGRLLERGGVREETLTHEDLGRTEGLFVVNALVGAAAVSGILGARAYAPDRVSLTEGREALRGFLAEAADGKERPQEPIPQ